MDQSPHMTHSLEDLRAIERQSQMHHTGWLEISGREPGKSVLVPVLTYHTTRPAPITIEAMNADFDSGKYDDLPIEVITPAGRTGRQSGTTKRGPPARTSRRSRRRK